MRNEISKYSKRSAVLCCVRSGTCLKNPAGSGCIQSDVRLRIELNML